MISPKILIFDVLHITYVSIVFFQTDIEEKSFMVVDFKELLSDDGIFKLMIDIWEEIAALFIVKSHVQIS